MNVLLFFMGCCYFIYVCKGTCPPLSIHSYPIVHSIQESESYPIWPLNTVINLSNDYVPQLRIYWNYTHFRRLNPDNVTSCFIPPEINVPFVYTHQTSQKFIHPFYTQYWFPDYTCSRVCLLDVYFAISCPIEPSGNYSIDIPFVGRVNITLNICLDSGTINNINCTAVPDECKIAYPFQAIPNATSCNITVPSIFQTDSQSQSQSISKSREHPHKKKHKGKQIFQSNHTNTTNSSLYSSYSSDPCKQNKHLIHKLTIAFSVIGPVLFITLLSLVILFAKQKKI